MLNNITVMVILATFVGGCVTGGIEEPKHKVIVADGDIELREYGPRIVAETVVSGDFKNAPNIGFRRLADFIFGRNTKRSEIAMTAPVTQQGSTQSDSEQIAMTAPVGQQLSKNGGEWRITFTMPSSYSTESLPKPLDPSINIKELPAAKFAAIRFSGMNRESLVHEKTESLRVWLTARSLQESGREPIYARYNPPWTPWFLRRNEILIELDKDNHRL